ncbi:MAG TPA: type II secretion system F family protein [Candidatus Norongarragalinales archaeon]|nr:type II secretion system F family protein [Candidatus Norongarragalinales archaeon]
MRENLFDLELRSLRIKLGFDSLLFGILAISSVASIIFLGSFESDPFLRGAASLAILALPASLFYFLLDYLRDSRQRHLEEELPECLFQIASFPEGTPLEEIIERIAQRPSLLGNEFKRARNMINAGLPTQEAIAAVTEGNSSRLLSRAISLLLETYKEGGKTMQALGRIAQDIYEMQALQRESASGLAMQKYSLLAATGILVPGILAILLSMASSLDFPSGGETIWGNASNAGLISAAILSIQVYLFSLSAIAGIFLAMQEGKLKKAPVYFCMLFPCSIALFNLLRGIRVF